MKPRRMSRSFFGRMGLSGTAAGSTTRMFVLLSSEATSVSLERDMRLSRTALAASTSCLRES